MANVYEKIKEFYKENIPSRSNTISSGRMEKYFRLLAWRGYTDEELQEKWVVLKELALLFVRLDPAFVAEPEVFEMQAVLYRAYGGRKRKLTEKKVNFALETLQHFFSSLDEYDDEAIKTVIVQTKHSFYEHGYFHPPIEPTEEFFVEGKDYDDREVDSMNVVLDAMMDKMHAFYTQPCFYDDVMRANMLFMRDKTEVPPAKDMSEELWFSFWDYFLFDYHLRQTDQHPIRYYLATMRDKLTFDERSMLAYLSRMRFKIFYIEQGDEDCVWCRDLLTDEQFDMPWPETAYLDFRQVLFCGHLENKGVLLLNYVTSYSVSPKLRQRIKHEIMRLYDYYLLQWPEATLDDFFNRHSIAVRHIISVLSGYARLNVVPDIQVPPPVLSELPTRLTPSLKQLSEPVRHLATSLSLGSFSTHMVARLYADFYLKSPLSHEQKISYEMLLAAVCAFLHTNIGNAFSLVKEMKSDWADVKQVERYFREIHRTMDLRKFDPRYAAEEGYVLSLFKYDK